MFILFLTAYLVFLLIYYLSVLIYDSLYSVTLKWHGTVAMLEHGIGEKPKAVFLGHAHQYLASECTIFNSQ